jgi:hypothetical protein
MFRHQQAHFWEFVDLPTFFDVSGHLCQLALTGFAHPWPMGNHLIGPLNLRQCMSLMTSLSPRPLAALWPRLRFPREAITRWGLTAVLAVFPLPPFQLLNAKPRPHEQRFQFFNAPIFLLGFLLQFCVGLPQLLRFFFGHALSLLVLSSLSQEDLSSYKSLLMRLELF